MCVFINLNTIYLGYDPLKRDGSGGGILTYKFPNMSFVSNH